MNKFITDKFGLPVPREDSQPVDQEIARLTTAPDPQRWNEVHTYFFAVGMANPDGSISKNWQPPQDVETQPKATYTFSQKTVPLDLPPSAISIGVQFASNVVATNRGVLEENNGIVFRTIQISGTTGLWPDRPTINSTQSSGGAATKVLNAIFPSAVNAINTLKNTAKGVIGSSGLAKTLSQKGATLDEASLRQTGYYKFWKLHNFFMEYAHNKNQRGANRLRLLFSSPKDNITYVVTPVNFELRRDSSAPLQYRYSITLRCWDITTASANITTDFQIPDRGNKLSVRSVLDKLRQARRALTQAGNVVRSVQSDINEIANVVNQGVLIAKDIVGLERDLMDFIPTMQQNINTMIQSNRAQWAQVMSSSDKHNTGPLYDLFITSGGGNPFKSVGLGAVGAGIGAIASGLAEAGESISGINERPSGESPSGDLSDAAGAKVIGDFLSDPDSAEATPLSKLGRLPDAVSKSIEDQTSQALGLTASDVFDAASKLKEVSENIAYSTGMMDPVYASTYGLPEPTLSERQPTEEDIILSAQIEEGRDAFLGSLASGTIYGEKVDNPFLDANRALDVDDQVPTPSSGIPIFVPRGSSLDDIAKLYLGDANRAREIAILNQLRAPYIDEEGFTRPLFLASDRTFVVNDRTDVVAGQVIRISGTGIATIRRKVLAVEDIGGGQFRVVVDGAANLASYDPSKSPYITARRPGTIGSGDTILIPTQEQADEPLTTRSTPLTERLSYAERVFKVDIALDDSGDLAVGPDGDLSRSYGYQNAVQALKLKLETEQGELEQHPNFGINASIGDKITGDVFADIEESAEAAVLSDPRYENAEVSAKLDGTALRIRVDADGANGTGLIPVEFKIDT